MSYIRFFFFSRESCRSLLQIPILLLSSHEVQQQCQVTPESRLHTACRLACQSINAKRQQQGMQAASIDMVAGGNIFTVSEGMQVNSVEAKLICNNGYRYLKLPTARQRQSTRTRAVKLTGCCGQPLHICLYVLPRPLSL